MFNTDKFPRTYLELNPESLEFFVLSLIEHVTDSGDMERDMAKFGNRDEN